MRILCDMDDVMADCVGHWLRLLNRYHGESLTPYDITDWDLPRFCKYATPDQVYGHLADPGFFLHLDPIPGAIEGIRQLMGMGHEVVFVTSCRHGHTDKRTWIARHLPEFNLKSIIFAERKELVAGDVLIDDAIHNLMPWQIAHPRGTAICFATAHNTEWIGHRYDHWGQLVLFIERLAMAGEGESA